MVKYLMVHNKFVVGTRAILLFLATESEASCLKFKV